MLAALGATSSLAQEQASQNEANNPLTPKITFNLHDYYVPSLDGVPDADANQALIRGLIPHQLFGQGQLFRFTLPIVTAPTATGNVTGLGDLTLMDLFVFKAGKVELGGGPMLVAPTASKDALGAGKWQAGAAGILIAPQKWGLLGGLATYQHSFAGEADRDDVSLVTIQPLALYNLPKGFYLRSTATWNFDLEKKNDYIPVGLGFGKVWQATPKTTINAFLEPQYTVWNKGVGTPEWQIFVGVNFQFAIDR